MALQRSGSSKIMVKNVKYEASRKRKTVRAPGFFNPYVVYDVEEEQKKQKAHGTIQEKQKLIEEHMIKKKGVGPDTCKQFFDHVKSARIRYETITTGPMGIVFDDTEIRSELAEYLGMVGQKYDWQYCSQDQATKAEPKRRPKKGSATAPGHAKASGQAEDLPERLLCLEPEGVEISKKLTKSTAIQKV